MRRANCWTEVVVVTAITIPVLITGCTRDDSHDAIAMSAPHSSAAGDDRLPEVVVTVRRPGRETMAMSDRDGSSAAGISATRGHRP